jgi:hypothetical protein
VDDIVLDAVIESLEVETVREKMEKAVLVAIEGKHKPDYVSEDGNCFETKAFSYANEHCLKNELALYKVVYGSDGEPIDLVKMGA